MEHENSEKHDIENLWTNQRATDNRVAGMESTVDAMANDVRAIGTTLQQLLTKPHESFDWKGVIIICLAVAGMAGGLVAATIAPISSSVRKQDILWTTSLQNAANLRFEAGKREGKVEALSEVSKEMFNDLHARMLNVEMYESRDAANINNNTRWLGQVDLQGPRKHIISAPEAAQHMKDL